MNTLPFWLPRLRRKQSTRRITTATRRIAPTTAPTAMPAMAPPERPLCELDGVAAADVDGDEVGVEVAVLVGNVIKAVIVGRTTPAHRSSALEL